MVSVNGKQNCGTVTKNPRCTEVFFTQKFVVTLRNFIQWLIDQTTFFIGTGLLVH